MYLITNGTFWDPDLELLTELTALMDRHTQAIMAEWDAANPVDETDYFDRMEHVTGLGFVACQAYLTATFGFTGTSKKQALSLGPTHACGRPLAEIVNHAANYWKHHDEWRLQRTSANREWIALAFDDIGFPVDGDYPLSGVLTTLVEPALAAFAHLLPKLDEWRTTLHGKYGLTRR
jgi:hypothetical protein